MRDASPLRRPNAATRQAMAEVRSGKKLRRFKTAAKLLRSIGS